MGDKIIAFCFVLFLILIVVKMSFLFYYGCDPLCIPAQVCSG